VARFEGKVSGFVPRIESGVFRKRQTLVWDFRLERYSSDGKPLPRVAVQMRAKFYRGGAVNNGDVVQVAGRQGHNGLVVVDSLKNLTSGTVIKARKWNASVFIAYAFFLLLFFSVVAAGLYFVFSGDHGISMSP
jgi:hypothetical protein